MDQTAIQASLDKTIEFLSLVTANPKPNITIEGETIDMTGYLTSLRETANFMLQFRQDAGGPYMRVRRMRPG